VPLPGPVAGRFGLIADPVRILLATDLYRPSIGGTERHVEQLAAALAARGHHAVVATTSPRLADADPPHVHRIGSWAGLLIRRHARPEQHFHPPAADPGVVRRLVALCRAERIDLIHAHGWMAHSAVPAARRCGIPVVVGLHDYGLDCARRSRLLPDAAPCAGPASDACRACASAAYGRMRGELVVAGLQRSMRWWDHVDAFVANSEAVASAARDAGVACTVAPPWLAAPDGAARAVPAGLPAGAFVAYIGAQSRHKGVATLTRAWADPAPAPLVALLSRPEADPPPLPAGTVVHRDAAPDIVLGTMARASVVVVPSIFPEPFGLVAAEAMSVGTPVVASAVGGLPEVLGHGDAGVLVPPDDPVSLRSAVAELLADPGRRVAMAARGRARAARLDGTEAILEVYERVLRPAGHPQASPASLRM
jgi:glycosyltransferase involved in cell wall biosynthesis